jgi:DNA-binding MurR/RpiR family transcriptional regulator
MNLLIEIQNKYNIFTEKEKSIANLILSKSNEIENTNIVELAKITETSPSTITRFSKKIGCESFIDMKIKLSRLNRKKEESSDDDVFFDIYVYYSEIVERTKELIDKKLIYKIVDLIRNSKKIYIYGIGSSGLSAIEMMHRLLRMGFSVHGISDSHMMIINSSIVSEKDLVIGISVSGETKEVVNALEISKKNGAKTVAVTTFKNSSITKCADIVLPVYNTYFVDKTKFINSQFSTVYLLDLICNVLLRDKKLNNNYQTTIDAILASKKN